MSSRAVLRSAQSTWTASLERADPVAVLREGDAGRLPELVPIRYGRMAVSPFTFYRGAAAVMARDLATTTASGIRTQLCGDAHLLNFGAYASPEGRLVFDVNDFDETLPGPFEWDVKRLATSAVIAARHLGFGRRDCDDAARACVHAYRNHLRVYATMPVLDVWYARLGKNRLAGVIRSAAARKRAQSEASQQTRHVDAHVSAIVAIRDGTYAVVDRPPLLFHPPEPATFVAGVRNMYERYRSTLAPSLRALLHRFELVDAAYKVVGVGSVGTRCLIALLVASPTDMLLLQAKEARRSALEPYAGESEFAHQGERVVIGQRAMQATSDVFLGWTHDSEQHDFYFRQQHDVKTSANVERMRPKALRAYVALCGWALARAHARAGANAQDIVAYVGRGDAFDDALVAFAHAYAEQNERDYATMTAAIAAGTLAATAPTAH